MARGVGGQEEANGPVTWTLLGLGVALILGTLMWVVGSSLIVFYCAPIFHALSRLWVILPGGTAAQVAHETSVLYVAFRQHSAMVPLSDWIYFINLSMQPWSVVWACVAVALFFNLQRRKSGASFAKKMTPERLAENMVGVFSEIAPVVAIQKKIVDGRLKGWTRQTFPDEFLRQAKYQKRPVLVLDPDYEGDPDAPEALKVDVGRLAGHLRSTRTYVDPYGLKLLHSQFLGRQIVSLKMDSKRDDVVFADRLSPTGKAVFAFLAPYAFGGAKGKAQSQAVKDALNYSAYGSPDGQANLAVDAAQESFNQWRTHPVAKKLAKIHHWEFTYLYALLRFARVKGKIGTWSIMWLKPMDRILFYVLNTEGRATPHAQAALAFSQDQFETACAKRGLLPIGADGRPSIFAENVVDAFVREWQHWREGDDQDENAWWLADAFDPEATLKNSEVINSLSALVVPPPLPPVPPL